MIRKIWVLTMFEEYFKPFLEYGVLGKVFSDLRSTVVKYEFHVVSIPQFCKKGFKGVDSAPFGGGAGMVMRADVLKNALLDGVVKAGEYEENKIREQLHIVCPAPRGETWNQTKAMSFAENFLSEKSTKDIVFICGRYEGIDERFLENYVNQFISMGDFILTGGELAVMSILDSSMRFSSGVLGNKLSSVEESFFKDRLEYALYTRPKIFEGKEAPHALVSGHHKNIEKFKENSSLELTKKYRPDLLKS